MSHTIDLTHWTASPAATVSNALKKAWSSVLTWKALR